MALYEKTNNVNKISYLRGSIPMEFYYTAGPGLDPFLSGLKDGKLIGSYCPTCEKTYLPSRMFCEICFSEHTEPKEITNQGTVESVTTIFENISGKPLTTPETVAMIRFPKTEGGLIHKIKTPDNNAQIGMKVKAIFVSPKERSGKITDILAFEPI